MIYSSPPLLENRKVIALSSMPSALSFEATDMMALPHSFSPFFIGIVSDLALDSEDSEHSAKHAAARVYNNRVERENAISLLSLRPVFCEL
jgi:hypothetical protein